ncbi:dUTP diphosphatase [Alkalicoccus urumqiensis]|uniref:dUTPase n=1 Tax=Alkalicoccus urumqiensis TaxID=1548213 RepID=A0A2P6MFB7_ALKUR|nr:dUTP diphosphatase [Alkalicoccus urumqiensis]PRO64963.1 dUTPase [Alkalicoccus urumqiensis]
MELKMLFKRQQELDSFIETEQNINGKDVFQEKLLAFIVETGELANEVRCFKFWSSRPPSDDQVILEEYVDGLHFLLSLGNALEQQEETELTELGEILSPEALTEAFLELYGYVSLLRMEPSTESYQHLFQAYTALAGHLGYEWQEVTEAYKAKHQENYERQQRGY